MSDSLQTLQDSECFLLENERPRHQPVSAAELRKLRIFTDQWTRIQIPVRAYLSSFVANSIAVDDCVQELAVVVWKKGPWEDEPQAFLGYSLACARRIALAARRRQNDRRLQVLSPEVAAAVADAVALQEQQDLLEPAGRITALKSCLEQLLPQQRELLEARYSTSSAVELGDYAGRCGSSMDCLYKKLERLRDILRKCVDRRQNAEE